MSPMSHGIWLEAARAVSPKSSHGDWKPSHRRGLENATATSQVGACGGHPDLDHPNGAVDGSGLVGLEHEFYPLVMSK